MTDQNPKTEPAEMSRIVAEDRLTFFIAAQELNTFEQGTKAMSPIVSSLADQPRHEAVTLMAQAAKRAQRMMRICNDERARIEGLR